MNKNNFAILFVIILTFFLTSCTNVTTEQENTINELEKQNLLLKERNVNLIQTIQEINKSLQEKINNKTEIIPKIDIAKSFCNAENNTYCNCAFKESTITATKLQEYNFTCNFSNESKVYAFDPCKNCGLTCIPEKDSTYYIISDKVESILTITWLGKTSEQCFVK